VPWIAILFSLFVTGCEQFSYYSQAIDGQINLWKNRESVESLIKQKQTPEQLKERLLLVQRLKSFAKKELLLPASDSFSHYVDLQQPYVVWNVFAAPEFSLTPLTWCFPIAGCVGYRGYFDKEDAIEKAKELKSEGLDVYVGGVRAYSTLGWFNDPLMNTFLFHKENSLVGLIFHELAHKKIYVQNDTTFNESFASTVELIGLLKWYGQDGQNAENRLADMQKSQAFNDFVLSYFSMLSQIYQDKNLSTDEKRQKKQAALAKILADYHVNKSSEGWGNQYQLWLTNLNNAKLSTVGSYFQYSQALFALYKTSGEIAAFYKTVENLSEMTVDERKAFLLKEG
jgi:predicted aminopeptidase